MVTSFHELTKAVLEEVQAVAIRVDEDQANGLARAIASAERIFVTGEGRTGLLIRAFAMRLMQMGLSAYVIGETITPRTQAGDLLIAVSGSGETATVLAVVESNRSSGVSFWNITASHESRLARMSDSTLIIPGQTKEKLADQTESIQPLSNLFAQALLITLDVTCLLVMQLIGEKDVSMQERHGAL